MLSLRSPERRRNGEMIMVEDSFDHGTFSLNRERLLEHDVAGRFFAAVSAQGHRQTEAARRPGQSARSASRLTSRSTSTTAPQSMRGPRDTAATGSASGCESEPWRSLAGSRRWRISARHVSAASNEPISPPTSTAPRTTCSASRSSRQRRPDLKGRTSLQVA